MNLNLFSLSGLIVSVTCAFLTIILLIYGRTKLHRIWMLFNITVAVWGIGMFLVAQANNDAEAIGYWKLVHVGGLFIAPVFLHMICRYCGIERKRLLVIAYAYAILYILLDGFYLINYKVEILFSSLLYLSPAGPQYLIFAAIWLLIIIYAFFELFKFYKNAQGYKKNQALYFLIGTFIGFSGGATHFLTVICAMFDLEVYPFGQLGIAVYCIIATYAIIKYRLMDITIVITRAGIFVAVYSLILGIPFALAFGWREQLMKLMGKEGWWLGPLVTSTVLATAGPFMYLYVQKKAENNLLQEQRRYQRTLRQASLGMGRIKELKKLVSLIARIVARTVKLDHAMIFLNDSLTEKYNLVAVKSRKAGPKVQRTIDYESSIVKYLLNSKNPIVCDEINQQAQDFKDPQLSQLASELNELDAALVVPSFVEDKLLAIMVMGRKVSGKMYSEDDLAVFAILASHAALAIENAQFYEETKKTHEQLFKAEKMATIGTMADGLSHQINNRLHALGFIAGDALDTIKMKGNLPMSKQVKEMMVDIEYALTRIQDNVTQGGEIVQGLLRYTRKGEEGFSEIELDRLIDAAIEMTQFKVKAGSMTVLREYGADIPSLYGNFTQLQEVFFNLIDNAYDAMMQRRSELDEPEYKATIKISTASQNNGYLDIFIEDNGIGIKTEDASKLFTPFFTTKLSSKKGTGLGLYVIQKLIEENHKGRVSYKSVYKKGTRFHLCLPIYK